MEFYFEVTGATDVVVMWKMATLEARRFYGQKADGTDVNFELQCHSAGIESSTVSGDGGIINRRYHGNFVATSNIELKRLDEDSGAGREAQTEAEPGQG